MKKKAGMDEFLRAYLTQGAQREPPEPRAMVLAGGRAVPAGGAQQAGVVTYFVPPHLVAHIGDVPLRGFGVARISAGEWRVQCVKQWDHYLHDLVIKKRTLNMLGRDFGFGWHDAFMQRVCAERAVFARCECVSAYSPKTPYLNLVNPGCDPWSAYYPSHALVGTSYLECDRMFQDLVLGGELQAVDPRAIDRHWACGNRAYALVADPEMEDALLEMQDMPHAPVWLVLLAIVLLGVWLKTQRLSWLVVEHDLLVGRDVLFRHEAHGRLVARGV
jgi:hypothetical protein